MSSFQKYTQSLRREYVIKTCCVMFSPQKQFQTKPIGRYLFYKISTNMFSPLQIANTFSFGTGFCAEDHTVSCENGLQKNPKQRFASWTAVLLRRSLTNGAASVEQTLLITMAKYPIALSTTICNADSCERVLRAPLCAPGYFRMKVWEYYCGMATPLLLHLRGLDHDAERSDFCK